MLGLRNLTLFRNLWVSILVFLRWITTPLYKAHESNIDYPPMSPVGPTSGSISPAGDMSLKREIDKLKEKNENARKNDVYASGFVISRRPSLTPPTRFDFNLMVPFLSDAVTAMVYGKENLDKCFQPAAPREWNLLTRNSRTSDILSPLFPLWVLSIIVRYFILLPIRFVILLAGALVFTLLFPLVFVLPSQKQRLTVKNFLVMFLAGTIILSWFGVVKYHGKRPKIGPNQIYVANHTSLIDVIIMLRDYPSFALTGQKHKGMAGFLQRVIFPQCVWFDRNESRDREIVGRMMKKHISNPESDPILVFPEGTCVNNKYCMQFKKGTFSLGATIHPVAIKYNKNFADTYWNSNTHGFLQHLAQLMTQWAVVCNVWYLEPQNQKPDESSLQFTERVKDIICKRAGLINVPLDGYLKRQALSPRFLEDNQKAFAEYLKQNFLSQTTLAMKDNRKKSRTARKKIVLVPESDESDFANSPYIVPATNQRRAKNTLGTSNSLRNRRCKSHLTLNKLGNDAVGNNLKHQDEVPEIEERRGSSWSL